MTRLIGAILALGLLSGCATYFKMGDEIAFSGGGVLASYDQSMGELTDSGRVGVSVSKQQMKPVELASERTRFKELAEEFSNLRRNDLKRQARPTTNVLLEGESRLVY